MFYNSIASLTSPSQFFTITPNKGEKLSEPDTYYFYAGELEEDTMEVRLNMDFSSDSMIDSETQQRFFMHPKGESASITSVQVSKTGGEYAVRGIQVATQS